MIILCQVSWKENVLCKFKYETDSQSNLVVPIHMDMMD